MVSGVLNLNTVCQNNLQFTAYTLYRWNTCCYRLIVLSFHIVVVQSMLFLIKTPNWDWYEIQWYGTQDSETITNW